MFFNWEDFDVICREINIRIHWNVTDKVSNIQEYKYYSFGVSIDLSVLIQP